MTHDCGQSGYDPFDTRDAADALDQAASYLDCALRHSKQWPEITAALIHALAIVRTVYEVQTGKPW